ncbi:16563_t:CDS:2 [Entrophospora sp. SA101]|nr:6152_t:CDS:2 [Entrophospora sp. SA101]CAJ0756843.1 16563_t:CDS:2 [Entrophospora sp. SA101]
MHRPFLKSYNSNYSSSSSSINSTWSTTSSASSITSASSTASSKSSRREKINRFGYCKSCNQPNTHCDWCQPCNSSRFKKDFDKWSSGNAAIDDFIKNAQSNATNHHQVLEWIPYDQFEGFRFVARGGFASVYSAIWKQGFIIKWADEKNQWERCGDKGRKWKVALKILDNSSDLSFDFFQEELQKWYWDIKDGVENEVSLQFKSADERNVQRSISSSTYRPITESHPLAIYTSRLLSFPNLSRPVRLPSSRSNSNKAYKTEKIDYVTRAFEDELVYEPESNLSTRRIDLEEISEEILSEVTFEPEIIEEEYVTRQYDIDLV